MSKLVPSSKNYVARWSQTTLDDSRPRRPVLATVHRQESLRCLTILYHPDLSRIGDRLALRDHLVGGSVAIARGYPQFIRYESERLKLPLDEPHVSRQPFVISPTDDDGIRISKERFGAKIEANGQPVSEVEFSSEDVEQGIVLLVANRIVLLLHTTDSTVFRTTAEWSVDDFGIVGASAAVQRLRQELRDVARVDVPVLLRGESGTGKELSALAIHRLSTRRHHRFMGINTGAVAPSLMHSELFGAAKGAYTGANQSQLGYFRSAYQGTLFLDEIGDASTELQVALLRVLEENEAYELGTQTPYTVDTRIIAATDAELDPSLFRKQLLHRLTEYEIFLPSLRERRDDFGHLLIHFLREGIRELNAPHRLERRPEVWLPAALVAQLAMYSWPGNIRELKNAVTQLLVRNRNRTRFELPVALERKVEQDSLSTWASQKTQMVNTVIAVARRLPEQVSEGELAAVLEKNEYEIAASARDLSISRTSLYKRIEDSPVQRLVADLSELQIKQSYREYNGDINAMVDALRVSKSALRRRLKELGLREKPR